MIQPNALISVHPEIHFGKPGIAGTRIPVANVLELLEAGITIRSVVDEYYSDLTEEQVRACIRYAIQVIHNDEYHFAIAVEASHYRVRQLP